MGWLQAMTLKEPSVRREISLDKDPVHPGRRIAYSRIGTRFHGFFDLHFLEEMNRIENFNVILTITLPIVAFIATPRAR